MVVFQDGTFVEDHEAKISIFNRGFLFGDGVYATIQVRDGRPLFLKTHLERLRTQGASFGLAVPPIDADIIHELIERNQAHEGIWKLKVIAFAGEAPEMRLPSREACHLIMLMHPFTPLPYAPLNMALHPHPIVTAHTAFKSLAHLSRYFVMEHALATKHDDGITTTEDKTLLEASFGNIFWVEGKKLFTPDPGLPLHFGVTITNVVEMAHTLSWKVMFVKTRLEEISQDASLFRCNTMSGIRPIGKIAEREFPCENSLEKVLQDAYAARIGELSLLHKSGG